MIDTTYHPGTVRPVRRRGALVKSIIIMLVGVLVVLGIVGYFKYQQIQGFMDMKKAGQPPSAVSVTTVSSQTWQPSLEAVASLRAVNGVDLSFETAGIVDQLRFKSGDEVQAGQVLTTLRLNDEPGKLKALQAQEKLAEITIARDKKQLAAQAVAQATIDADTANLQNLQAQVAQVQAQIDEKIIKAPFAGQLGVRQIDLGQYLAAGTNIVTLQALDPIYVDFTVPQQALDQLHLKEKVSVKVDAYPDQVFTGDLSAINPKIDPQTRNIQARATVRNADHKLKPGMYATISISSGSPQSYITVPQTAINYAPYGNTVYVVTDDKDGSGKPVQKVDQAFVTTGPTRGDQIAVLKGLKEGQVIVTAGQMKLHKGALITVNNSIEPASDANPTPQEQ